jgi:hypothetical protein
MKLGDNTDVRMKKLGQSGICIVKCKAPTKKNKIYIFNLVPGNSVKTGYQKPGTGTGAPGFWFFQTGIGTGTPIFRFQFWFLGFF